MKPELRAAIENNYAISICKCISGPRQFVAETYILEDSKGCKYFCKLIDKPLFIREIIKSLPVVAQMHANGIDRITYPIRAHEKLHIFVGDTLVVLFNYIPALQSYDYNAYSLGLLTAQIHAITPHITADIPRENFQFPGRSLFDAHFENSLCAQNIDPVIQALQKVLFAHEKDIHRHYSKFLQLGILCRSQPCELVITHGDAPGNVLVKSQEDIYIIDWDETMLAPAERDLWMVDHLPDFISGYESIQLSYAINKDMRSFYILKYYFRSMMHYFSEILGRGDQEYRLIHVNNLEENLLTGWMMPKLNEIDPSKN